MFFLKKYKNKKYITKNNILKKKLKLKYNLLNLYSNISFLKKNINKGFKMQNNFLFFNFFSKLFNKSLINKYLYYVKFYTFFFNIIQKKNNIFLNFSYYNDIKNINNIFFVKTIESMRDILKIQKKKQKFKLNFLYKFYRKNLILFYKIFFYNHIVTQLKFNFKSLNNNILYNLFKLKKIRLIISIYSNKKVFISRSLKIFRYIRKKEKILKLFSLILKLKKSHNGCKLKTQRRL